MTLNSPNWFWLAFGFIGQALFSMRFLIQWIASERRKRSVVPVLFWYFSLAGGTVLLIYAIWRQDPVFILGQGMGLVVYVRNLHLIRRERQNGPASVPPQAPPAA